MKCIEGILVEDDCHGFIIECDDIYLDIPFSKIEEYAESGTGLSDDEITSIMRWWCMEKVKANKDLEDRWRKMKPIDWSRY